MKESESTKVGHGVYSILPQLIQVIVHEVGHDPESTEVLERSSEPSLSLSLLL